jgi:RNA polymerase sigma factor (TIGR02999 family)
MGTDNAPWGIKPFHDSEARRITALITTTTTKRTTRFISYPRFDPLLLNPLREKRTDIGSILFTEQRENCVKLAQSVMASEVTLLLDEIAQHRGGENREALDKLLPIVYNELRRLAASFLRREYDVSIQTTELVHEAYFKLTDQRSIDWKNRGQFFAVAAQAMRRILIDAARQRRSLKRGAAKISLDDSPTIAVEMNEHLIELDLALEELAEFDEEQSRLVELRYFGGLTIEETAEVMQISPASVKREWMIARMWLYAKINGE